MNVPGISRRDAELLEQRAQRLRRRLADGGEEDGVWGAEFGLGRERYALPLEHLLACLPLKGVTPVPKARPEIVGVTRWEGKVVAVFSLATLLGQKGWFHDPSVLLMLRYGGSAFGLDCEETPRSLLLPRESLAAEPRGAQRTVTLPAAGPLSGRTLQWIDPDRLLDFPQQP